MLTLHQKQILQKALSANQRKAVAPADFAGPHNSFPITNQTQVNSAARLAGHAANPDAVRAAIKRIAKRKGLKLPEAWTEKDRNYSAHAGQQIAGRLFRGAGGKFSSGGGATDAPPDNSNKTDAQRIADSAKYAGEAAAAAGPKGKGGGKGGKGKGGGKGGKASPAANAAAAEKTLTDALGADLAKAMAGGDLSGVNSAVGDKLVSMGLAIKYNDGTYQLSGAGKSAIAAAAKGDKLKTAAALALAKTRKSGVVRPTKQPTAAKKPAAATATSKPAKAPTVKPTAAPKTPAAKLRAAAKPKAPAKPKAAPKPKAPVLTPEQKKTAADAQKKTNFAQVAGKLSNPDVAKTLSASPDPLDTSALNDAGKQTLVSAGLGTQHTNGTVELNATGQALIRAMQSGDIATANRLIAHAQAAQQDAAAKLAAQQAKKKVHKEFFIFKDAQGQYRWITFSSSSYEDKDGETIAQKALEEEVMRAERTGDYGPLCWWHMNGLEKGQPLVKLGDCDFSTMVGRVLVESGTFLNEMIAKAVERASGILGTSIGFIPTPRTRGEGAVFKSIEIKERSLLPDFAASNYLANKVFVGKQPDQEVIMSKLTALKALFGGGKEADDLIASITSEAQIAEKAAKEQGLTYKQSQQSANQIDLATAILNQYGFTVVKEDMSKADPEIYPQGDTGKKMSKADPTIQDNAKVQNSKQDPDIQKDSMVMDAAPLDPSMMSGPDGGNADPEDPAAAEDPEAEALEGTAGDEEIDNLIAALHEDLDAKVVAAVRDALAPIADGLKTALADATATATKETGAITIVTKQVEALTKQVEAMQAKITELEGEAPAIVKGALATVGRGGVRPSQSGRQVVNKEQADELDAINKEKTVDPYDLVAGKMYSGMLGAIGRGN